MLREGMSEWVAIFYLCPYLPIGSINSLIRVSHLCNKTIKENEKYIYELPYHTDDEVRNQIALSAADVNKVNILRILNIPKKYSKSLIDVAFEKKYWDIIKLGVEKDWDFSTTQFIAILMKARGTDFYEVCKNKSKNITLIDEFEREYETVITDNHPDEEKWFENGIHSNHLFTAMYLDGKQCLYRRNIVFLQSEIQRFSSRSYYIFLSRVYDGYLHIAVNRKCKLSLISNGRCMNYDPNVMIPVVCAPYSDMKINIIFESDQENDFEASATCVMLPKLIRTNLVKKAIIWGDNICYAGSATDLPPSLTL